MKVYLNPRPIFLIALGFHFITSCSSAPIERPKPSNEGVFRASFSQTWSAAERILSNYPMAESNSDTGVMKTDFLRGKGCYATPGTENSYSSGVRCSLTLYFIKVSKKKTRLRIEKNIEIVRDFISSPEPVPDDGLEELTLLYRLERELNLEQAYGSPKESLD